MTLISFFRSKDTVNPGFKSIQPYPFQKLAKLLNNIEPADIHAIDLSLGEPKHPTPKFILDTITGNLGGVGKYPPIKGGLAIREAIRDWLISRYHIPPESLSAEHNVLPVTGTREALFAIAHCIIDPGQADAVVVTGNPFYQIYEGAALFAGAKLEYVNTTNESGLLPDYSSVSEEVWSKCQILYICSPNNPTGQVMSQGDFEYLFEMAEKHDFIIAADECYSEIYLDETAPPLGTLQAAHNAGLSGYKRCMVFHSLSKRSNVPGMRSGFVAGDSYLIEQFYRYRTYHGCSMAPYVQEASISAWNDETHVVENRKLYREKFDAVLGILSPVMKVYRPSAGFYLWPETPIDDVKFTTELIRSCNVTVLPGSYTSREVDGINPGSRRIRIALVAPLQDCIEAAKRIHMMMNTL
jgi:N-succinyldiaminopimelate aminotransferase